MIPTAQEIVYRLYGAWLLARFDAGGAQYFDESPQAALRSFFAAVLVAPASVVILLLTRDKAPPADPFEIALVTLLGYSLLWTVFPLIAYRVCLIIDRERAFFRYLCADNWTTVIRFHFQLVVLALVVGGIVPAALATLVLLAMHACLLAYSWFVARSCLDIGGGGAAGFVVLEYVVGLVIQFLVSSMLYSEAA